MKLGKFIVNFIFYLIALPLMAIMLGPQMVSKGKQIKTKPFTYTQVDAMYIKPFPPNTRVVQLVNVGFISSQDTIALQFRLYENNHERLLQFLYENGLLKNKEDFRSKIHKHYNKEDLAFINALDVLYVQYNNKDPQPDYLALNGENIKGSIPYFRKYATIVFGYIMIIVSVLMTILLFWGSYYQLKEYKQTGKAPTSTNKWDGLKEAFRWFKKE